MRLGIASRAGHRQHRHGGAALLGYPGGGEGAVARHRSTCRRGAWTPRWSCSTTPAVERRFSVEPIERLGAPRTLGDIQDRYREHALGLGPQGRARGADARGRRRRRHRSDRHDVVHGDHDPVARRLPGRRPRAAPRRAPAADHGAGMRGRRGGARAGARLPGRLPGRARAGHRRRAAQPQHAARRPVAGEPGRRRRCSATARRPPCWPAAKRRTAAPAPSRSSRRCRTSGRDRRTRWGSI